VLPISDALRQHAPTISHFKVEIEDESAREYRSFFKNNARAEDVPCKVTATTATRMWRLIYLFLLFVRVYFALCPSYLHPDEIFQGPEPIAGMCLLEAYSALDRPVLC
jgi:hypothetical protein